MPQRENTASKQSASAFKPPSSTKRGPPAAKQPKLATAIGRKPSHQISSSDEEASSVDTDFPSNLEIPSDSQDPSPTIPLKLLTRLLHHHFEDDKTRLGPDANALVGKYMETFVREALARAAFERSEGSGGGTGGSFLEVEDLEKLAPQLLLDF